MNHRSTTVAMNAQTTPTPANRRGRRAAFATFASALAAITALTGCGANASDAATSQYGDPVLPVTAVTIAGTQATIPAPGKATVLIFYTVGCGTCVEITQHIASVAASHPAAEYVAVNIDPKEDVRSAKGFLDYINSPALIGINDTSGTLTRAYQVASVSTVVVLNTTGQIVLRGVEPQPDAITAAVEAATG